MVGQVLLGEPVRVDTIGPARPMIRIYHEGLEKPLKHCVGGCSIELPKGHYRVAVARIENTYAYDQTVEVRQPTRILIDPGDKSARRGMLIGGWTLIGLSIPLALFGLVGVNGKSMPAIAITGGLTLVGGIFVAGGASAYSPSITATPL